MSEHPIVPDLPPPTIVATGDDGRPGSRPLSPPPLSRNRNFAVFWLGQSLSNLGDTVALIAMPLLVLRVTGSVIQMGFVTGAFGIGQLLGGIVAGPVADRVDRRRFMIACDIGRTVVYAGIPAVWWIAGPQQWLLYAVSLLGAFLGMCFSVTYIAAIANLVDRAHLTDANGRLQASAALAGLVGPALAGGLSARYGPAAALGVDALSFGVSAASLACIRLRSSARASRDVERTHPRADILAGVRFLWRQPVLRALTAMIAGFSFLTLGATDLFIFRLRHDLGRSDGVVGLAFSVASVGAIFGGLLAAPARRRFGFGVCYVGSAIVEGVALVGIGGAPWIAAAEPLLCAFTFLEILKGVNSIALRQQVTPDHLLGRVTAAFWTINSAPGPLGAALLAALAARIGAGVVLTLIGVMFVIIALLGLRSPARARFPERESADLSAA